MAVAVDRAGEADLAAVEALEREWAREDITPNPYDPTDREGLRKHAVVLVARADGAVVGHLTADRRVDDGSTTYPMGAFPAGTAFLYIEGMYVRPAWRGRGVGAALLSALAGLARAEGVRHYRLTAVHRDMGPLVRFYRAHGFTALGEPGKYGELGMVREDRDG